MLSIVSVAFLAIVIAQYSQIKHLNKNTLNLWNRDSIMITSLMDRTLMHGQYIDIPLHKSMIVTDSNNSQTQIETLIKSSKYIYYFQENNCFTCVEEFIPFLSAISQKVGSENLIILGSYTISENFFAILKKYNLIHIPRYNLSPHYLKDSKIASMNKPLFFRVNSELESSMAFVPEKELPELSVFYYQQLPLSN